MLKKWRLRNFKSFREMPDLDLGRINVLSGPNSSGKSSIIQSILLLKQTIQYGSENRPIALNGPLLRLGSFDDVKSFESGGEPLEIELEFEFDEVDATKLLRNSWDRYLNPKHYGLDNVNIKNIRLILSYDPKYKTSDHQQASDRRLPVADLNKVELKVRTGGSSEGEAIRYLSFKRNFSFSGKDDVEIGLHFFNVDLDNESVNEIFHGKPDAYVQDGWLNYFLPSWCVVNFDVEKQNIYSMIEGIFNRYNSLISGPNLGDSRVSGRVVSIVNDWLRLREAKTLDVDFEKTGVFASRIREILEPFIFKVRPPGALLLGLQFERSEEYSADIASLREQVLDASLAEYQPSRKLELEAPREIQGANNFLREFLKEGIRYLGPLRDSPRPVYQLEALESTTNVGYRGEHTAAVLELNRDQTIEYHSPPDDSQRDGSPAKFSSRRRTLHDAVVDWLSYLEVAHDVATSEAGVFGHTLQVSTDDHGRFHDLTNVGVGVSQVLPIVVMALLAPSDSLLIFEQPELHLHPKVQAKLADFFIALALNRKQTILETHSEYLIDRFRLRIALSENEEELKFIKIIFTQKINGRSELIPIEINSFGAVLNWPKDFFDQSQRDVSRIIAAASKKRFDNKKN